MGYGFYFVTMLHILFLIGVGSACTKSYQNMHANVGKITKTRIKI